VAEWRLRPHGSAIEHGIDSARFAGLTAADLALVAAGGVLSERRDVA